MPLINSNFQSFHRCGALQSALTELSVTTVGGHNPGTGILLANKVDPGFHLPIFNNLGGFFYHFVLLSAELSKCL